VTPKQKRSASVPAVVLSGNLARQDVVLATNDIALAITRSLGRRHIPVYRFHPDRSLYDLHSRYCEHIVCPNLCDKPGDLVAALLGFAKGLAAKPVLFPASDEAAEFLSEWLHVLGEVYAIPVPPRACMAAVQNKQRLYETARSAGLSVPRTHFPTSLEEAVRASQTMHYPAIIKPTTSYQWKSDAVTRLIGKVKAITVTDAEAVVDTYKRLCGVAPHMMIQEIIPGPDERCLTYLAYVDREGRVLRSCVRKKMRQSPPGFGYCCLTETVEDDEVAAASVRLLRALQYHGIVGVEFKRDPRDGVLKVIEVNARAVRTTGAAIAAGADLPYVAYMDAIGRRVTASAKYKVGLQWIHLRDEMLAARELIKKRDLTFGRWLRVFRRPMAFAEWAADDPWPFLLAWQPLLRRAIRSVLCGGWLRKGTPVTGRSRGPQRSVGRPVTTWCRPHAPWAEPPSWRRPTLDRSVSGRVADTSGDQSENIG